MAKRRAHGEGSIYQRASDGRWVAKLPVRDAFGHPKSIYRYRKTEKEALKALRQLIRKHEDGSDLIRNPSDHFPEASAWRGHQ
ncbi:MAG: hypothetical protein R3A46_12715 [Thermomicrobiales bacterium]